MFLFSFRLKFWPKRYGPDVLISCNNFCTELALLTRAYSFLKQASLSWPHSFYSWPCRFSLFLHASSKCLFGGLSHGSNCECRSLHIFVSCFIFTSIICACTLACKRECLLAALKILMLYSQGCFREWPQVLVNQW